MPLTEDGLLIPRMPEILADIENKQRELISPEINNRDDQLLSNLNAILSERLNDLYMMMEAVRDSWDIARAEGRSLDDLLALKKIYRIPAGKSFTNSQRFVGRNGVVIPAGRVLINENTGDRFVVSETVTISITNTIWSDFTIPTFLPFTTYQFSVNGILISFTTEEEGSVSDIYSGLEAAYNDLPAQEFFIFQADSNQISIIRDSSNIGTLRISHSQNIQASQVSTLGTIEAQETGPIIAPISSVTRFLIPITGVVQTYNGEALSVGRLEETDEQFRLRGITSVSSDGTATVPSITSSLYNNVPGVSSVTLVENDTHEYDSEGRPPHSYEVIVVGGDEQLIGLDLWRTKPSSIPTYGSQQVIIVDSDGNPRLVYFTRPSPVNIAVNVTYTLYDEEIFPPLGNDIIRQIVSEWLSSRTTGEDVIPKRLYGPIYNAVPGINDLVVEVQVIPSQGSTPDPADWTADSIPISSTQYSSSSFADVYVAQV